MKILFFSDIHGIVDNLNIIEKQIIDNKIDKIVCLGDLYYAGPTYDKKYIVNSKEVHYFLTKYQDILICMKGNCDSAVDIKASDFPISDGVSLICVDNLDIYVTHGHEYNFEKNRKFSRTGILVYGHEHIPYIKKSEQMIYINVGSISLPRNDIATYAIYENRQFVIYGIDGKIVEEIKI